MMSTPVIDLIHCHGSARKYRPDPVPAETIEAIVAAGQRASTSSNYVENFLVVGADVAIAA